MQNNSERKPVVAGLIASAWKIFRRPSAKYSLGALLIGGFFLGIMFWGGFHWVLDMTNTEAFCISCHEMRDNPYSELKASVHFSNRTGVRATCPDCHVPKVWAYKVVRKIKASNELLHKALGTINTREKFKANRLKMAKNVWASMMETDSRECRNCHSLGSMDKDVQVRMAKKRHDKAIKEKKTCIECHQGIAHDLPKKWQAAWKDEFGG